MTSVDAKDHELVGPLVQDCSELVALALWLMAERHKGSGSEWEPLLRVLPVSVSTPGPDTPGPATSGLVLWLCPVTSLSSTYCYSPRTTPY